MPELQIIVLFKLGNNDIQIHIISNSPKKSPIRRDPQSRQLYVVFLTTGPSGWSIPAPTSPVNQPSHFQAKTSERG